MRTGNIPPALKVGMEGDVLVIEGERAEWVKVIPFASLYCLREKMMTPRFREEFLGILLKYLDEDDLLDMLNMVRKRELFSDES